MKHNGLTVVNRLFGRRQIGNRRAESVVAKMVLQFGAERLLIVADAFKSRGHDTQQLQMGIVASARFLKCFHHVRCS